MNNMAWYDKDGLSHYSIGVTKLTGIDLMREACAVTIDKPYSEMTLDRIYKCEHSPIRTQLFWVEMWDIPSFVSVHFVRHKIGVEHFVKSLRDDRCGNGGETRDSLVNHSMLINAQALINMARKRLCSKAHIETQKVMNVLRNEVAGVDPDLRNYMLPECMYRNGCYESKPCGFYDNQIKGR